jgi:small GTP-binding protein
MLKCGIVGLPNSGKSTLFNALLQRQIADTAEYPFTTIEPNVGVVQVPDERLEKISKAVGIKKIVPAAIEFIDIAGLVEGAHKGEGLGNKFLGHIREVDAILHLVRGFHNPNVEGAPNPEADIEIIKKELKQGEIEKPTIYLLNIDEKDVGSKEVGQRFVSVSNPRVEGQNKNQDDSSLVPMKPYKSSQPPLALIISAKLEAELSELSPKDRKDYLSELGLKHSALDQVIKKCYKLLGLITFFTIAGGKQVQAWPTEKGTKAVDAAGIVHTDMEKGFVKAERIDWEKLVQAESWKKAAEKGLLRLEGRDHEVKDGDVVEFKFNV